MFKEVSISNYDKRRGLKFPKKLSEDLAELCGIHIGDGYLSFRKKQNEYLIQCAGHPVHEKSYYDNHISKLWKSLFNVDLNLKHLFGTVYGFRLFSKGAANFFHHNLEMPFGKKSSTIRIPDFIKKTCKSEVSKETISCLRGIIDTDFYFCVDKGRYPILGAWFASKNLVLDIEEYFKRMGLSPRIRLDDYYTDKRSNKKFVRHAIRLRKKDDVNFWFRTIKTNNPKLYKKYNDFLKLL